MGLGFLEWVLLLPCACLAFLLIYLPIQGSPQLIIVVCLSYLIELLRETARVHLSKLSSKQLRTDRMYPEPDDVKLAFLVMELSRSLTPLLNSLFTTHNLSRSEPPDGIRTKLNNG